MVEGGIVGQSMQINSPWLGNLASLVEDGDWVFRDKLRLSKPNSCHGFLGKMILRRQWKTVPVSVSNLVT